MKKGQIAAIEGTFNEIDTSEYPLESTRLGETLYQSLRVGDKVRDLNGNELVKGQAARQTASNTERYDVSSKGEIVSNSNIEKITEVAEFLCSMGEYVVTESTQTVFVFEMITEATEVDVRPYEVDIESLIDAHPNAVYWLGGIYNRPGNVGTSDAYSGEGGNIFDDDDFGDIFRNSNKNRIGMEFDFETDQIKLLVTESGYVEIYRPSEFDSLQFKRLIDTTLMPHLL